MTTLDKSYPTNNHEAICLWDMDGTICDYDVEMNAAVRAMKSPEETWTGRAHAVDAPWMKARISCIRNTPGFWRDLPWHPRGRELVKAFEPFDLENHILTKGPKTTVAAWSEKVEWCMRHVPDFHISISQKKSLVYGKVLVDDWPGYFLPWLEVRPRGLVIAIKHDWNKDVKHKNLVHYDGTNLGEVIDRVAQVHKAIKR